MEYSLLKLIKIPLIVHDKSCKNILRMNNYKQVAKQRIGNLKEQYALQYSVKNSVYLYLDSNNLEKIF